MRKCNGSTTLAATLAAAALLLAGCAAKLPREIREAPPSQPTASDARQDPQRWSGARVRWGGELLGVTNLEQATELEILARTLESDGEPEPDAPADARFIARIERFLDPAEYADGERITVAGRLGGVREGLVGEYRYLYPVVEVEVLHRWPEPVEPARYAYPPYFGWPYHDPWWPHRPLFWHPHWHPYW